MTQHNPYIEPARIEEIPSFTLAGISAVTTNAVELSGNGKIGKLFEQFYSRNIGGQLADHTEKPGLYSCYFNYEQGDAGQYEVMVSLQVEKDLQAKYPESVTTFTVPTATYAVFVTERGPVIEKVQQAWAGIWQWSRQPGNERTFTGDFEFYGPDIDMNDGQMEIYIAVKQ
ncbi:GyrI-like domain-containing protein [Paenibacillus radicis (ex Gao et al. 2016)]|uniref:DNA-binding protein n=1 Tax=Paenibacillus radicis (ex Gao et al. 2016) TaxID=1737354 RepID=A0A917H2X6_9BACL|nr:GyrI-like domain-containing protein [Paenibacillus radicis (ex Gao et al. 2016)]GGG65754.1 DNA-binding protein [Paenibacillus radicis (ex Gao et al. 2016)]